MDLGLRKQNKKWKISNLPLPPSPFSSHFFFQDKLKFALNK